jgi:glycosyltransferase involved in cell wall biosynthesis
MMKPLVSVVMSVYNGEKYLREAVESILNQTFTDFEFIIVNDGSTDRSRDILESYADERIILIHQENAGLTRALNTGIARAHGTYIARQDADDVSKPERLEKQIAHLEANPRIGMLSTRFEFIDAKGAVTRPCYVVSGNELLQERLIRINQFCHGAAVIRKEALEAVGGFREYFRYAQDHDLWLRIAEKYEIDNLPEFLFLYRELEEAISSEKILMQSQYAGVAIEMALQRRTTGTDDIMLGKIPQLPPVERLTKDLHKKLSDFYSQNPGKMLDGLQLESKRNDLAFVFQLICNDRMLLEEEVRQKNQQLRQNNEGLNSKDAQIRMIHGELESAKHQLDELKSIHVEKLSLTHDLVENLGAPVAEILREFRETHETVSGIVRLMKEDVQQKNTALTNLQAKYDEKLEESVEREKRLALAETAAQTAEKEILLLKTELATRKDDLRRMKDEAEVQKLRFKEQINERDRTMLEDAEKNERLRGGLQEEIEKLTACLQDISSLKEEATNEQLRLENEIVERDRIIFERADEAERLRGELAGKTAKLVARDEELRCKEEGLARINDELVRLAEEQRADKRNYEQQIRDLEQRIDDLLNSKSWRVTAPLRAAVDLIKKTH